MEGVASRGSVHMDTQFESGERMLQLPGCRLFAEEQELGTGQLTIEESCLRWVSADDPAHPVSLEIPSIAVHAISRDTSSFPHESVYLMYCPSQATAAGSTADDDETEEEDSVVIQYRIVPPESGQLETLYSIICECQMLFPDPEQSESEEDQEEDDMLEEDQSGMFYTSAEQGLPYLSSQGRAVLEHLESIFHVQSPEEFSAMVSSGQTVNGSEQFEDLDDDEEAS